LGGTPVLLRDFLASHYPNGVRAIGPGSVNVNLSVSKTFGFGKRPGQLAQNNSGAQADGASPDGQNQTGNDNQTAKAAQCAWRRWWTRRLMRVQAAGAVVVVALVADAVAGVAWRGGRNGATANESSRFTLQLSAQVTNLLNHVNFGQYSGVLTSPFFGQSSNAGPAVTLNWACDSISDEGGFHFDWQRRSPAWRPSGSCFSGHSTGNLAVTNGTALAFLPVWSLRASDIEP